MKTLSYSSIGSCMLLSSKTRMGLFSAAMTMMSCAAMISGAAAQGTCATAIDLTSTPLPLGVVVSNASTATGVSVSCYSGGGNDVWLRLPDLVAGSDYSLTTSQAGESDVTDTRLEIFHGACGSLETIACADDSGGSLFADATFTASDAGPYYVLV
ncbi:MAG: hypothetical protein ABI579_07785, partial [Candidatus Sumerlaeota bacterium]